MKDHCGDSDQFVEISVSEISTGVQALKIDFANPDPLLVERFSPLMDTPTAIDSSVIYDHERTDRNGGIRSGAIFTFIATPEIIQEIKRQIMVSCLADMCLSNIK